MTPLPRLGCLDRLERHRDPGGLRPGALVNLVQCLTVAKVDSIAELRHGLHLGADLRRLFRGLVPVRLRL